MPTYTYRCTKCGEEIEAFQSMSDPPLKRCKKCRGALRRTLHPVGIVLKGSGFHRNDYRSKSSGSKDSSSERSESKSDTKSDSKSSDAKSEKKDSSAKPSESKSTDTKSSSD